MSEYETGYQALGGIYDDDEEADDIPVNNIVHVVSEKKRWNHIQDLDEFFTRIYDYHQNHGIFYIIIREILYLCEILFVGFFLSFITTCVNYDKLLNPNPNDTHKVKLPDCIYTGHECLARYGPFAIFFAVVLVLIFLCQLVKSVCVIRKSWEMREFFIDALHISGSDLCSLTWHDIQNRIIEVQREQQMCIHKKELTQLDIYNRIMRFKNYMIAMINKELLPLKLQLPFIGEYVFLSSGLKYNLELICFWGPLSLFENNWHLREEYKLYSKRKEMAAQLQRHIQIIGIINVLLAPIIFFWQFIYILFRYLELCRRDPGSLGLRRWSMYARFYFRHFNELDHEFTARLNRAYEPSVKYMSFFSSPLASLFAKEVCFITGTLLAYFCILAIVDEDFLNVDHILSFVALLGVIFATARVAIPNEYEVWCPDTMMKAILAQLHYMPDHWSTHPHTTQVRDEFNAMLQFHFSHLIEELLSCVVTPYILLFKLRPKSLAIVDFFRNFTVEVQGVGDVCSFAQMDIRRHHHPLWKVPKSSNGGRDGGEDKGDGTSAATQTSIQQPKHDINSYTSGAAGFGYQNTTDDMRADERSELLGAPSSNDHGSLSFDHGSGRIQHCQAEHGKTEMSLLHFKLANPEWEPPEPSSEFIRDMRNHTQRQASMMNILPPDNPLMSSLHSVPMADSIMSSSGGGSVLSSMHLMSPTSSMHQSFNKSRRSTASGNPPKKYNVNHITGPLSSHAVNDASLLSGVLSVASSSAVHPQASVSMYGPPSILPVVAGVGLGAPPSASTHSRLGSNQPTSIEHVTNEMTFAALYLHAMHRLSKESSTYYDDCDAHERMMWGNEHQPNSRKPMSNDMPTDGGYGTGLHGAVPTDGLYSATTSGNVGRAPGAMNSGAGRYSLAHSHNIMPDIQEQEYELTNVTPALHNIHAPSLALHLQPHHDISSSPDVVHLPFGDLPHDGSQHDFAHESLEHRDLQTDHSVFTSATNIVSSVPIVDPSAAGVEFLSSSNELHHSNQTSPEVHFSADLHHRDSATPPPS